MTRLTRTQRRALDWLAKRGGSGTIDRYGRVLAGGEHSPFDASTWLRLVSSERLVGGGGRLHVSDGSDL